MLSIFVSWGEELFNDKRSQGLQPCKLPNRHEALTEGERPREQRLGPSSRGQYSKGPPERATSPEYAKPLQLLRSEKNSIGTGEGVLESAGNGAGVGR